MAIAKEQFELFASCKTPEEIVAKAEAENIDITLEQAANLLKTFNESERVSDEVLAQISGGCSETVKCTCGSERVSYYAYPDGVICYQCEDCCRHWRNTDQ